MKRSELMEIINKNTDASFKNNQKLIHSLFKRYVEKDLNKDDASIVTSFVASDRAFNEVSVKIFEEALFNILIELNLVNVED
ncbi:hypothetical protein L6060_002104 [Enterococcus faecalis]|uniref:hypothetical protein n=1 Tax=Bacteria TaxID=2 RepID=UPI0001F0CC17|nr:hypothetical protein [Enterococcus faecalis]EFU11327.1 hypothetical protein HMPREF9517_02143 [Enterococcus faecalis TX1341]EGO2559739.1 hypothetical protein [Enterococcus faecalis]EGO2659661.1 hypothetical protein [Enterococcus faecalis]EGO2740293.1 hypothetical protein [Enterococcus faecalis]EGO2851097.1 hypothetical protein [Enterococcus faecalis]